MFPHRPLLKKVLTKAKTEYQDNGKCYGKQPTVICTSTKFRVMQLYNVANRMAIWHCTHSDATEYRLSYTITFESLQPIVLIVTQWPIAV